MKEDTDLWLEEMLKRHGWYIEFNYQDTSCPYNVNIHTHGIPTYHNHLDFQICFPMEKRHAYTLIRTLVNQIIDGEEFMMGIKYKNIIQDYEVEFAETKESHRTVLRVIFPDVHGEIRGKLKDQWRGCEVYIGNN